MILRLTQYDYELVERAVAYEHSHIPTDFCIDASQEMTLLQDEERRFYFVSIDSNRFVNGGCCFHVVDKGVMEEIVSGRVSEFDAYVQRDQIINKVLYFDFLGGKNERIAGLVLLRALREVEKVHGHSFESIGGVAVNIDSVGFALRAKMIPCGECKGYRAFCTDSAICQPRVFNKLLLPSFSFAA